MTINANSMLDEECGQEFFDSVTDEELIYLWRWIKGRGISANEAWNVVLTGLALDKAFDKRKTCMQIEH